MEATIIGSDPLSIIAGFDAAFKAGLGVMLRCFIISPRASACSVSFHGFDHVSGSSYFISFATFHHGR